MRLQLFVLTALVYSCSLTQEPDETANISSAVNPTEISSPFSLKQSSTCEQSNLSQQFDLSIDSKRFTDSSKKEDSVSVRVIVRDKLDNSIIDSILVSPCPIFEVYFSSCDSVTSYSTSLNVNRVIVDNYFGDFIVADLNFDGKDDLAIINDSGGNGGPSYMYYTQTKDRKFVPDKFLSDSVIYFPTKIDKRNQKLVTYVHAGACCVGEHIYKLNKTENEWKQVSHKILGYEKMNSVK